MQRDPKAIAAASSIGTEVMAALGLQGRKVLSIDLALRPQDLPTLKIIEAVTVEQGQALAGMLRSRFKLVPVGEPDSLAMGTSATHEPDPLVDVMAELRAITAELRAVRAIHQAWADQGLPSVRTD